MVDHSDIRLPLPSKPDQSAIHWDARNKCGGAINRVQHPDKISVDVDVIKLLTKDTMIRVGLLDHRS